MGRASSINPHEPEALPVSSPQSLGPYPTAALLVSPHTPASVCGGGGMMDLRSVALWLNHSHMGFEEQLNIHN